MLGSEHRQVASCTQGETSLIFISLILNMHTVQDLRIETHSASKNPPCHTEHLT